MAGERLRHIKGRFGPWPSPWSLGTLLAAAAAGYGAYRLHVPLAWILGPLVAVAIASMCGLPIFAPLAGRRFGQVTVGSSIGLNISAAVALLMLKWLPAMIVTALTAVVVAAIVSVPFRLLSGLDRQTAYYAMMPGGLSEMANLGAAAGARSEPIAISQALRVALLVIVLPPLIIALDIHGVESDATALPQLGILPTLLVLACGGIGVAVARLARFNNPWMIGALAAAGILAATGLMSGRLPLPLYWLGQFLIGISIGSRFQREIVVKLPRVFVSAALFVLVLAALLFGYAASLSWLTGLDLASATLGASPGGLAEMAITAQTLHLSVGLVTGFHIVRAIIVNGFCTHIYRGLERTGLFDLLERRRR